MILKFGDGDKRLEIVKNIIFETKIFFLEICLKKKLNAPFWTSLNIDD